MSCRSLLKMAEGCLSRRPRLNAHLVKCQVIWLLTKPALHNCFGCTKNYKFDQLTLIVLILLDVFVCGNFSSLSPKKARVQARPHVLSMIITAQCPSYLEESDSTELISSPLFSDNIPTLNVP